MIQTFAERNITNSQASRPIYSDPTNLLIPILRLSFAYYHAYIFRFDEEEIIYEGFLFNGTQRDMRICSGGIGKELFRHKIHPDACFKCLFGMVLQCD